MTYFATLEGVKAANDAGGHFWFTRATMSFFDTKIESELLYPNSRWQSFVYSNHFHPSDPAEQVHYPRHFKVALVDGLGRINSGTARAALNMTLDNYATLREAQVALATLTLDCPDGWA